MNVTERKHPSSGIQIIFFNEQLLYTLSVQHRAKAHQRKRSEQEINENQTIMFVMYMLFVEEDFVRQLRCIHHAFSRYIRTTVKETNSMPLIYDGIIILWQVRCKMALSASEIVCKLRLIYP